jgi:DNA mismatch repair protein MutL
MPIKVLAPEVASQIAAGEVVERPASVVKELLENAIDAGASRIEINIETAGRQLVEVSDNGNGISEGELSIAVARHATSKLQTAEELFQIESLGFRGEALASIGSVSRLTIVSRPEQSPVGARLQVDGGQIGDVQPTGAPVGTVVRVEDLFYNVPARLKFLKTDQTERRWIDRLVTHYAIAYPDVSFQLMHDGRKGLQTAGNGKRREILATLYGVDLARQLIDVQYQDGDASVSGFISPPNLTRANRREMIFFVNGRPVQDSALSAAVMRAYHTLLMVRRFPLTTLLIRMPPEHVDVNVHPTKAEVRFRDSGQVFSILQRAVRRTLLAHTPIPDVGDVQLQWRSKPSQPTFSAPLSWDAPGDRQYIDQVDRQGTPDGSPTSGQIPFERRQGAPILRLVGQIASSYLVAEGPDGLYLVDQHAAHERVLFEKLLNRRNAQDEDAENPRQDLLQPVTVQLPPEGARLLEDQLPILDKLGFRIEPFGPGIFQVRSLPVILSHMDPSAAVRVVVEDFEEDETPLQSEVENRIAARVCKRAAVKAGQTLSEAEQVRLIADLETCESPRTCPHGRPTMIHLSVDLLERQFGRRGAR